MNKLENNVAGATHAAARDGAVTQALSLYRVELTGYCYRMLGSAFEAEDAVQETSVRAWRGFDQFEQRASMRSWLYRIATNVCLSMVSARQRRARPMDLGPAWSADSAIGAALDESTWIEPIPDAIALPLHADPVEQLVARESIRLAFITALQVLPARQRAVLILCDVLHWQAHEVADLLGTTEVSVQSALQRARATLDAKRPKHGTEEQRPALRNATERALLDRYVDAFTRFDIDQLVSLLHEDATLSMPPYALWLQGTEEIRRWWHGPGAKCAGSRVVRVAANGSPAIAQYRPSESDGYAPFAIHVLDIVGDRIVAQNSFLDTARLFPLFGLPARP